VRRGSGTFVGIQTLKRALEDRGVQVDVFSPARTGPVLTASRLIFNERLRFRSWRRYDVITGFDLDGYRIAGKTGVKHIAAPKGVIADEMRFESGLTRRLLGLQAACERRHIQRADCVLATSEYSASAIRRLYGMKDVSAIVPELIDLHEWQRLLKQVEPAPHRRFTVLSVCRFYPRKRICDLLGAASILRERIPDIEFRIVGGGPEQKRLLAQWRNDRLENVVTWLHDIALSDLAREYASADLFCLPSLQEGFGIVFLEAMAAGLPVVAARAGAATEVVPHALFCEPANPESLAAAIAKLYADPEERAKQRECGFRRVREFDAPRVAQRFLEAICG